MRLRLLLVITTSDFGGSESFLLRLVSGLDPEAFEVEVCSLCPPGHTARAIAELGIPVTTLGMNKSAEPLQMAAAVPRLARLFRTSFDGRGAHGVQSLLYRANVLCAAARRLVLGRRPFLVTGQRSLIPTGRSLDFRAQRFTRSWADRVVAVSEAVKRELHATESVADKKVVVIQNGIDLERFAPPTPGEYEAARASWDLSQGAVVVGAVGRIHRPKGLDVLVEAFAQAREQDPRLVLVLAGNGPDQEAIETQVDTLGLREHVRFLGYCDDPRPLYPGFDLYVLPSRKEGSPNALLEAMGRRCACIASNVGGVPEALEDGESGRLVPAEDPRALADALRELASDPELRSRLAATARRRVEERFDIRQMILAHEALYQGLRRR